jgi:hypothetical protein
MGTKERDVIEAIVTRAIHEASSTERTPSRVEAPADRPPALDPTAGAIIGKLVAMRSDGRTPLVRYRGQPGTAPLAARTVIDLLPNHVGSDIVLLFEEGDCNKPLIMGVLREGSPGQCGRVQADVDGETLVVSAKDQVEIRCGKASIKLTSAGKVLIEGEFVISRARRTNRVEGGAVQIN